MPHSLTLSSTESVYPGGCYSLLLLLLLCFPCGSMSGLKATTHSTMRQLCSARRLQRFNLHQSQGRPRTPGQSSPNAIRFPRKQILSAVGGILVGGIITCSVMNPGAYSRILDLSQSSAWNCARANRRIEYADRQTMLKVWQYYSLHLQLHVLKSGRQLRNFRMP